MKKNEIQLKRQIVVRLTVDELDELDRTRAEQVARVPGATLSRAAFVKQVLDEMLLKQRAQGAG